MESAQSTQPTFAVQRSAERAFADHGWLKSYHSFSFADYHDPKNVNWGALRVFNDDVVAPGMGFGTHPHRDMEIISYVLDGELEHRDSLGNHGIVPPGGVQYVSAGTGVAHSEFNHSKTAPVHFVQMWVLPERFGEKPNYGQREFERAERLNRWLTIASGVTGVEAPIRIRRAATLSVARLEDAALSYALATDRLGYLFVAVGEVEVNGERLWAGDAVRTAGIAALDLRGSGELVLWDVPPVNLEA